MISFADIEAARDRIKGAVCKTPCLRSRALSELTGLEIFCKHEELQHTGSFKPRLLLNTLLDGLVFLVALPAFELIDGMQQSGMLPVWFTLP